MIAEGACFRNSYLFVDLLILSNLHEVNVEINTIPLFLSEYSSFEQCSSTVLIHFQTVALKFNQLHKSDVFSLDMLKYGDGTHTVRQTTRGKLITFVPKFYE